MSNLYDNGEISILKVTSNTKFDSHRHGIEYKSYSGNIHYLWWQTEKDRDNGFLEIVLIAELKSIIDDSGKYPVIDWYNNEKRSKAAQECEKRGWCFRPSHTQIEWTDLGLKILYKYS